MIMRHIPVEPFGILLASWADGSFVSTSDTFLLEKNEGAGWVTVPGTEYALHASIGEVVKRDYDASSGSAVAWADGASFRATYTLINSTTLAETTRTQEAQTADYLDEFVASDGEGELMASAPRDLIVQEIFAGRGVIGKWTINKQYLARDTGTNATSAGMAPLDYPFFAGATYANRASGNFRVNTAGDVVMAGSLTVGGSVTVSGAMQSDDYVANSKGWKIGANGKAEFRNIEARGEIHAAVFVKNLIKATAGSEIIAKSAGTLKNAVTTVNSPTTFNLDIKDPPTGHAQLFSVGDILRMKDEAGSDAWVTVSSVSNQTTFYRYVCTKSNGSNATFQPGTSVIDYGASGQGFLYLTADDSDGPFYSVRTHAGSPWSTTTERGRFGNMNGAFGVVSNYYGFGVGDYAAGNYLKYETNGGFLLKAGNDGVSLDSNGISIVQNSGVNYFRVLDGADEIAGIRAFDDNGPPHASRLFITAKRATGATDTTVDLRAYGAGADAARIALLNENGAHSIVLDVDSVLVGRGTGTGVTAGTLAAKADYAGAGDWLALSGETNYTGTGSTGSVQGTEGYVQLNHASGNVTRALGVIANTDHIGAGTLTESRVLSASHITRNGCGAATDVYIFKSLGIVNISGTPGTITNAYGLHLGALPGSGVTNRWGVYQAGAGDKNYFAGRMGIGTNVPSSGYSLETSESMLVNSTTNNSGFVARFTGASSASVGAQSQFIVNDGAAMASQDRLGILRFAGYDGSNELTSALMIVQANEAWTGTQRASKFTFYTTPNGSTTLTIGLVIEHDGSLTVTNNVSVGGEYRVDGTKVVGNRITGWGSPTGTATRTAFDTSTVTTPQLAERVKALIDDQKTHGMIGA